MRSKEEMVQSLQNPKNGGFPVTYVLFPSEDRQKIAYLPMEIEKIKKWPKEKFAIGTEDIEGQRNSLMDWMRDQASSESLINGFGKDTLGYYKLKSYFEAKIKELDLKNPLIFFDDDAYRIDIGYGEKEFSALFADFLGFRGLYDTLILGKVSFLGKSPEHYFFAECIHPDYEEFLKTEKDRLLTMELDEPLSPRKKLPPFDTTQQDDKSLIEMCFMEHQGCIIGENHVDQSPKQFLIDNMPIFKAQGVTTLYMEHLLHERHQTMLDDWLRSPPEVPMPIELEQYLNYLDKGYSLTGTATFLGIVKAAKENGIRIVAIDTEVTYQLGAMNTLGTLNDTDVIKKRYQAMNRIAVDRFREYNDGEKFVAFIGSGHVSTCLDVPGVSDLLACPNIVITDVGEDKPETVERNVQYGTEPETTQFDILYSRHVSPKPRASVAVSQPEVAVQQQLVGHEQEPELFERNNNESSYNQLQFYFALTAAGAKALVTTLILLPLIAIELTIAGVLLAANASISEFEFVAASVVIDSALSVFSFFNSPDNEEPSSTMRQFG
jgi:hypothetical protein